MKKIAPVLSVLYYALIPALFFLGLYMVSVLIDLSGWKDDLGVIILATYAFVFFFVPLLIAIMMRFSPLKWVVDPFAAAEIPVFFYGFCVFRQFARCGDFVSAARFINASFCDDGGMDWFVLFCVFAFGIVCSFSLKRVRGESLFYKLAGIIAGKKKTE